MHALTLPLALLATACLPFVVAAILCADEIVDRVVCDVGERLDARRERRTISRLNRLIDADGVGHDIDLTRFDRDDQPTIEQIAADLRRLGRQRIEIAGRSRVWQDAVIRAYDDQLRQASRCLGLVEHLGDLDGVDLEIERVRVEGQLQAAGLILPAVTVGRRGEQR